jgi:predicted transcriptional regulator of viral defense system
MTQIQRPNRLALFQRATDRQGVFTLKDALQAGYSQPLVHHFVQTGRFQRIGRGVYRIAEYPHSEDSRLAELSTILGPEAVLSHESALALYPVSDVAPRRYHFTVPRSQRYIRPPASAVLIHTASTPLDPRDIVRRHGFTVTSLARSIVDSARIGTAPEQIQAAVRAGLARGLVRIPDFNRLLVHQPRRVRALVERALSEPAAATTP